MTINQLKSIANEYAEIFNRSEEEFLGRFDEEKEKYNEKQSFIITNLAGIYSTCKQGIITDDIAKEKQKEVFNHAGIYVRWCDM